MRYLHSWARVVHRIDDLEKAGWDLIQFKAVVHRTDDLEN